MFDGVAGMAVVKSEDLPEPIIIVDFLYSEEHIVNVAICSAIVDHILVVRITDGNDEVYDLVRI